MLKKSRLRRAFLARIALGAIYKNSGPCQIFFFAYRRESELHIFHISDPTSKVLVTRLLSLSQTVLAYIKHMWKVLVKVIITTWGLVGFVSNLACSSGCIVGRNQSKFQYECPTKATRLGLFACFFRLQTYDFLEVFFSEKNSSKLS
jgi:hypothetical protein